MYNIPHKCQNYKNKQNIFNKRKGYLMKKSRKLMSILLIVAMLFTLVSPAMADDGYTITITNTSEIEHEYEAYQIFAGTVNDKGNLGNIAWGSGISNAGQTALGEAKTKAESLKTAADAEEFAKEVAPYLNTASGTSAKEGSVYTISGLAAGYYLVKDADDTQDGNNDVYTGYILKVVKDTTASPKLSTKPTAEKKVDDKNDSNTTENGVVWQDSADYDIEDAVPFQLKGTVPADYEKYATYYYAFHDKQSNGLTFNENSVVVKVDGTVIAKDNNYDVITDCEDGCTFEIVFADLKAIKVNDTAIVNKDSEIVVEYTSTLNEGAVIGSAGNPNEMYLEYSNNPNVGGEGDTGRTPDDKVIVFTYKVVVNKVTQKYENGVPVMDGDKPVYEALHGAGFTLYKYDASVAGADKYVAVGNELKNDTLTTFEWKGLDDGNYKLEETTTPAGYNTIAPIEFTITANHEIKSDDPKLTDLNGNNGFTGEVTAGSLSTDVVNNTGATLPETGGMGTTIFYVVGGALVLGAAILLVTRRRMAE